MNGWMDEEQKVMENNGGEDDLDLLLSLQDRVLETPPQSPNHHGGGYLSDDGPTRQRGNADMSVFRNAVEDCIDYKPNKSAKCRLKASTDVDVEKFSGLKIRNQLVSPTELSDRLADIRFIRLPAIKNLLSGETLAGCWATVGILYYKGMEKMSTKGKPYSIWEIGCLNEQTVSLFLFGNAYQKNRDEEIGAVFALFNCNARKSPLSKEGYSLTVFTTPSILKLGTSADYGKCKSCAQVINKSRGIYCKNHKKNASENYSSKRAEFMGGNFRTAFNSKERMQSEGIYMVENKTNVAQSGQPKKVLSVEGLRKALSKAGKVTTNAYSQGIRFLSEVAGKPSSSLNQPTKSSDKRKSSVGGSNVPEVKTSQQLNAKRIKIEKSQKTAVEAKQTREKMVELELLSSDDEF